MNSKLTSIVGAVLLTACVSAPEIDYYTLDARPSGSTAATVNLEVGPMVAIEALAGRRIYIQSSPTRVDFYATDRWAASVGELVQQKLAVELGDSVPGRRTLALSGTVLDFGQVDAPGGPTALVRLAVEIRDAEDKRYHQPLLAKTYTASAPAAGVGADAVVTSLSRCVEQIAAEIASDAASL